MTVVAGIHLTANGAFRLNDIFVALSIVVIEIRLLIKSKITVQATLTQKMPTMKDALKKRLFLIRFHLPCCYWCP